MYFPSHWFRTGPFGGQWLTDCLVFIVVSLLSNNVGIYIRSASSSNHPSKNPPIARHSICFLFGCVGKESGIKWFGLAQHVEQHGTNELAAPQQILTLRTSIRFCQQDIEIQLHSSRTDTVFNPIRFSFPVTGGNSDCVVGWRYDEMMLFYLLGVGKCFQNISVFIFFSLFEWGFGEDIQ